MALQPVQSHYLLLFKYMIIAGVVAGSLDAIAAIFILSHGNATAIFKFISSGIYGKDAFTGGGGMVQLGIALHYFITFFFTVLYFTIFSYVPILHKSIFVSAILYGIFIYIFMNIIILSLSNVSIPHRNVLSIIKNASILMVFVAFPIVYIKQIYNLKCLKP